MNNAQLIVRKVHADTVSALKNRAARAGVSTEEEHRRILEGTLSAPRKRSFAEVLLSMPKGGEDSDFARLGRRASRKVSLVK
jgi:antitoxin FitA